MNRPYRVHPALPVDDGKPVPFPQPPAAAAPPSRLALLLRLEGDMRALPSWAATVFHALNEPQALLGHGVAFFFRANRRGGFVCEAASDVAGVAVHAPLVAALTALAQKQKHQTVPSEINLAAGLRNGQFSFPHGLWLPLLDGRGRVYAALLLAHAQPWTDDLKMVAQRVAGAYGFALRAQRPAKLLTRLALPRWAFAVLPLVVLALAFVPVPLTTLAPFEVVPRDPFPVTAPLEGVVARIEPEPNAMVKAGDVLALLDTTELEATRRVAEERLQVAEQKLATARNGAFADADMKRSLAVLQKEQELAEAELAQAKSRLARARIVADVSGVLVYASKSDWLGKPVRVGEKVLEIADPTRAAVRVVVGVHDSVALDSAETMRLFFDHDPLRPWRATVYEKSYHATEQPGGQLGFEVRGDFETSSGPAPRIGHRGTAQLLGQSVPLGFYILRRPLAGLRQFFGV